MVYVLSEHGQPLMPTGNHAKVRVLLKSGRAVVVKKCPFTIKLLYKSPTYTQKITLGVDAGSKHIGLSATTKDKVLYESDTELRNDIVDLLSTRRELRRSRRNRKTRYRAARFNNRRRKDGWLAPSVQNKVDSHLTLIRKVHEILPITKIIVEVAAFDMQKLKADMAGLAKPKGSDYQKGEQSGFWNVREYVLFRDDHKCQCCKGKSKDPVLNVHHIESRKTGGNAPNNLITLCETCHKGYHSGTVKLPKSIRRGMSFRDATFMGIMRWAFYNTLKEQYPDVRLTYGHITKTVRIENGLSVKEAEHDSSKKTYLLNHVIDARCISGNPKAVSNGIVYYIKKVRCHNRQIHKNKIFKRGYRKLNQCPYKVNGFRLYDRVSYKGTECFIFGRRRDGRFAVRLLDGTKLNEQISCKKLSIKESAKHYITEMRMPLLIGASSDVPAAI
ncbi:RNA-guided endonuclease IscB [Butyrivibrio sp.]|uniref:RNA-guided endonuclease IscB n=1 Tax=Butyrivibrio sp. TaxID=28121 RepID=UPI0025C47F5D|nr:RNA-guided endonuclease IscB [Butyrivibrio sp.]MBQ7431262.1 RRXRR domain-containing protein [Butyrivibrio sp.]MBQ9303477.1 RRXRR domain-containing protein [Butyrivibrio sp.]